MVIGSIQAMLLLLCGLTATASLPSVTCAGHGRFRLVDHGDAEGTVMRVGKRASGRGAHFEKRVLDMGMPGKAYLPSLAAAPDGTLLCAFVDLKSVFVARSSDEGRTWSAPRAAMRCPRDGYIADPNVLVTGRSVKVYATFVPAPYPPFIHSETWAAASTDAGATWGPQWQVAMPHKYTSGKVHVPIRIDRGTLAMGYSWDVPAEEGHAQGEEIAMHARCGLLLSRDDGWTWKPGGDVDVDVAAIGADEPATVRLKDGTLFMIVRTASPHPYETRSRDGGKTWDPPRPSAFFGYNSPSCLLRLRDGAILRVWDNSATSRYPLVASVSTDECRTWSPTKTITEPETDATGKPAFSTACYPSAAQAKDGTIVVSWWQTGPTGSVIGMARFNRAWLR